MQLQLFTLGHTSLRADSSELESINAQKQRAAFVIYLAVEGGATRERLMAMFWPDVEPDKARHSLNQLIYSVRRILGEDALAVTGDRVRLDVQVEVDAHEFSRAATEERCRDAIALYHGPFLGDVALVQSAQFEQWIEQQQARLGRLHRHCRRAALQAAAAVSPAEVLQVARSWAEFDPQDDEAQHRYVEALIQTGDRTEALRHYAAYERLLASDQLTPLDETKELIARLKAGTARMDALAVLPVSNPPPVPSDNGATRFPRFAALIAELKRRHVLRVVSFYLIMAWGSVEVSATTFPMLNLPSWAPKLVLVIALAGLPFVVFFAWQFDITPDGIQRTHPRESASAGSSPSGRRMHFAYVSAIVAVVAVALSAIAARQPKLDPNGIAVLPAFVSGDSPEMADWREAVPDLIYALVGGRAPRIADPALVYRTAAKIGGADSTQITVDEAARVAREVGVERFVLIRITGGKNAIVLSAEMHSVGERRSVRTQVAGHPDSIFSLTERLAIDLLGSALDEDEAQISTLRQVPVLAARAYLDGQSLFRRGNYADALKKYRTALEFDSTFALAVVGYAMASTWSINAGAEAPFLPAAWAHRDRLSPRDRALLMIYTGPNGPPLQHTVPGGIAAIDAALGLMPDNVLLANFYADELYHQGELIDIPKTRAKQAFDRVLKLDSTFAAALRHRIELAATESDAQTVRRLLPLFLTHDSEGNSKSYLEWRAAMALGDSQKVRQLRAQFDNFHELSLNNIMAAFVWDGVGGPDAVAAANVRLSRGGTTIERRNAFLFAWTVAGARGRAAEAERYKLEMYRLVEGAPVDVVSCMHLPEVPRCPDAQHFLDGLANGGDTSWARTFADSLRRSTPLELLPDSRGHRRQIQNLAVVQLWDMERGDTSRVEMLVNRLEKWAIELDTMRGQQARACSLMIQSQREAMRNRGRPNASHPILDHFVALAPVANGNRHACQTIEFANIFAARLYESYDDLETAYTVSLRQRHSALYGGTLVSTFTLQRAELAHRLGRTKEAIAYYRHYLALRYDPEPHLLPEVRRVRAALAQLTRTPD